MKYVGTYSDPKDIVTKEKLEAVEAAIPTKTSQLDNDSGFITSSQAPVQSVNNKTGAVQLNASDVGALPGTTIIPSKTSQLDNDSGFITIGDVPDAPVTSVNGKTGAVALTKNDIGLGNVDNVKQYSASNPPPYPVTSVNSKTGAVTIRELPSVTTSDNGKFLRVVNGAWSAVTIPDANGGSF